MENKKTEQIILDTAISLFAANGYNGVSMQMVADKSNTNKALIHYYYRNKQLLFEKVFLEIAQDFLKILMSVFEKEMSLTKKIELLISNFVIYGQRKPDYIFFLITEIKRNENLIQQFESLLNVWLKKGILNFYRLINEAVETRQIKQIHPRKLLEIILTACFSDVVNKPFFEGLLGKGEKKPLQIENEIKQKTGRILKMISSP